MKKLTGADFLQLRSMEDLAEMLGIKNAYMRQVLLYIPESYTYFTIPKKRGGLREIEAPADHLKQVQSSLNELLQRVYLHVRPECSHGFISNEQKAHATRNIVTNAQVHVGAAYLLNIDLEDFFHSIDAWRVKEVFMSFPFFFSNDFATCLSILTTYRERLPMGAATSPVISNFACFMLDRKLMRYASVNGLRYTRYADDLSFSSKESITEKHLAEITAIITGERFNINNRKTRIQRSTGRQTVTGLKVNEKVNVDRNFIRSIRAMLHNWQNYGFKRASFRNKSEEQFIRVLKGKLDFLGMVRGTKDDIYVEFLKKFDMLRGVGGY